MTRVRLDRAPSRFRVHPDRVRPGGVDREARLISGVSVVTRGQALGHDLWLDEGFLESVAGACRCEEGCEADCYEGIKSRFAHPGLSSDGTGKVVGRIHNLRREGDRVLGDLRLLESASQAPDGDLAGYVMDLAEEDPGLFGVSIVFGRDREAEEGFLVENTKQDAAGGSCFVSPDPENEEGLPHAGLRSLAAADVVDDPAANPGGFFSAAGEVAESATGALAYVLGLSDRAPEVAFGVHPDRARQFVGRFFANRGLTLETREEADMPAKKDAEAEQAPAKVVASLAALKASYPDAEFVLECLGAERSPEEAEAAWTKKQLEELRKENQRLRSEVASAAATTAAAEELSGAEAVPFGARDRKPVGVLELAREIRDEANPKLSAAQRLCGVGMREALSKASRALSKGGA